MMILKEKPRLNSLTNKLVKTLIILMLFFLTACGNNDDNGLVGTWTVNRHALYGSADTQSEFTFIFNDDGTGILITERGETDFTWEVTADSQLIRRFESGVFIEYSFEINGNELTLRDMMVPSWYFIFIRN